MKRILLSLGALAISAAAWQAETAAQAPTGAVEGVVTFEAAPPARRSAPRYPGGAAQSSRIQQLPALAYIVGPVPGDPNAGGRVTMTQRDTTFVPPVVAVQAGGSVAFPNDDPFFHNVFSYSSAQRFDLGRYPRGESKSVTFAEPGIVEVFCEVHEFMRGAVIVTENRFHSVVGESGRFRIEGIPAGEYTLAFWQADHQPLEQRVSVRPGATARIEVELRR